MRNRFIALLLGLVVAVGAAAAVATPAQAAACPITRFGHTGYYLCGTLYTDHTWSDGKTESYVIGTDSAVWHIHSGTGGWQSLGGNVSNRVTAFAGINGRRIAQAIGPDGKTPWCKGWLSGSGWNSWEKCDIQSIASSRLSQGYVNCADYYSCPNPGVWCADFARWVWRQAHVHDTGVLTAAAASFITYGKKHGTWKTSASYNPKPGDAIVFQANSSGTYAEHVGLVIEANSSGVTVEIGGNQSNRVSRWTSSGGAHIGDRLGSWTISGFVEPKYNIWRM